MPRRGLLRDWSNEHHHTLVLARRLRRASAADGMALRQELERAVLPHFAEEEATLLPALASLGEHALVQRTRDEHARLRALLADRSDERARLQELATLIVDHVRFEERQLFAAALRHLGEAELERRLSAEEAQP